MNIYKVHFTGRTKNAIGKFYSISDAFHAKDDVDFISQFWEMYELGTITGSDRFWFDVTVNDKPHKLNW